MGLRSFIKGAKEKADEKRKTLSVGRGSWHHRVYNWYMRKSGARRPAAGENLCHYMRVVLIWAPLYWYLKDEFLGWTRAAWSVIAIVVLIVGGVYISGLVNETLLTIAVTLAVIVAIAYAWWAEKHPRGHKQVKKIAEYILIVVTAPLWIPLGLAIIIGEWFFNAHFRWEYLRPVTIAIPIALVVLAYLFPSQSLTVLLLFLGFCAVVAAIAFVAIIVVILGKKFAPRVQAWLNSRKANRPVIAPELKEPQGTPGWALIYEFARAEKNRFACPRIRLPDDPEPVAESPIAYA